VRRETGRRRRQAAGRQVGTNARQRRPVGVSTTTLPRAEDPHHGWSEAWVHDEPTAGRRLKGLTGRDDDPRARVASAWARALTAGDVGQVRPWRLAPRGAPVSVTSDHGPEGMAPRGTTWRSEPQVKTHCSAPGSPWQNGHHERGHGVFRECVQGMVRAVLDGKGVQGGTVLQ
jgi:putative transposase